jgi:hypothetical protein
MCITCVHWIFPSVTALLLDLVIDCLAQLLHPHPLQYTVLPVCYPHYDVGPKALPHIIYSDVCV